MNGIIEILVRGVQFSSGLLLLAQKRGAKHTFLPGGHISFGESAEEALIREIKEELGKSSRIIHFLGAVEHGWKSEGARHHELNLLFRVEIEGMDPKNPPSSMEDHIRFLWQPIENLVEVNLQPNPLQKLLPLWLKDEPEAGWGSTIRSSEH